MTAAEYDTLFTCFPSDSMIINRDKDTFPTLIENKIDIMRGKLCSTAQQKNDSMKVLQRNQHNNFPITKPIKFFAKQIKVITFQSVRERGEKGNGIESRYSK